MKIVTLLIYTNIYIFVSIRNIETNYTIGKKDLKLRNNLFI